MAAAFAIGGISGTIFLLWICPPRFRSVSIAFLLAALAMLLILFPPLDLIFPPRDANVEAAPKPTVTTPPAGAGATHIPPGAEEGPKPNTSPPPAAAQQTPPPSGAQNPKSVETVPATPPTTPPAAPSSPPQSTAEEKKVATVVPPPPPPPPPPGPTTIVYYRKAADGQRVVNALNAAGLRFSIGSSSLPESFVTNAIACGSNTDPATLQRVIRALVDQNISIVAIYQFRNPNKQGIEVLAVSSDEQGREQNYPPGGLAKAYLLSLRGCP